MGYEAFEMAMIEGIESNQKEDTQQIMSSTIIFDALLK